MSFESRHNHQDTVSSIAAAFTDVGVAQAAVGDLARAGINASTITVMSPGSFGSAGETRDWFLKESLDRPLEHSRPLLVAGLLEHRLWYTVLGALLVGLVVSLGALVWANAENWLIYGAIGAVAGALTGSVANAAGAPDAPRLHPDFLGAPISAVTVEVETTDTATADVAQLLMARHAPALVQSQTRPAPRGPSERVMWQHENGISPLAALDSWLSSRAEIQPAPGRAGVWRGAAYSLIAGDPRADRDRR
jgi:hypothetical protein